MGRTTSEIAVIERGHPGGAETFGQGDQRSIGAPQADVRLDADQFGDASPVRTSHVLDSQVAGGHRI